jgi:hypothetical protein
MTSEQRLGGNVTTVKRYVNRFVQCYEDAQRLQQHIARPKGKSFALTAIGHETYIRAAALLYIAALEALINRVYSSFIRPEIAECFEGKDGGKSLPEKWMAAPLLAGSATTFRRGADPWQSFVELVQVRNSLVHPKANSEEFAEVYVGEDEVDFDFSDKEPVYAHTRLPKNTDSWGREDLNKVKKCVDSLVQELQSLMSTQVTDRWLRDEEGWRPHADQVENSAPRSGSA